VATDKGSFYAVIERIIENSESESEHKKLRDSNSDPSIEATSVFVDMLDFDKIIKKSKEESGAEISRLPFSNYEPEVKKRLFLSVGFLSFIKTCFSPRILSRNTFALP